MKWRDAFDLPRRYAPHLPPALTSTLIALAMIALAVGARSTLDVFFNDVVPFALIFPAIVVATLLGGRLAGALTLAGCQLAAWYCLLPPVGSFAIAGSSDRVSLILATFAELIVLWATSAYRTAACRTADLDHRRADNLALALYEMDHRTRNNFQIVSSLLHLQARRSAEPGVTAALEEAADRIASIAAAHHNLAVSSTNLGEINLRPYLHDVCDRVCTALADNVALDIALDECSLGRDRAVQLGMIVNELITNAVKHAFDGQHGRIMVKGIASGEHYVLHIADNGSGRGVLPASPPAGSIGTSLIDMLARQADIRLERLPLNGTAYRIELVCDG